MTKAQTLKDKPRKPKAPSDFDSEEDFIADMRKKFERDINYDRYNREEAIEDLRFAAGLQWDDDVAEFRDASDIPNLVINNLPATIAQVINARMANDIGIKVIPDVDGAKEVAQVREDLIRQIQDQCDASYAYNKAFEHQVITGMGNFRVDVEYAYDDVFDQDVTIHPIENPLAVVWDYKSIEPSGRDADHVFMVETWDPDEFKRLYPDVPFGTFGLADNYLTGNLLRETGWYTPEEVRIVHYYRMRKRKRLMAMLQDGNIVDVTDVDENLWTPLVMIGPTGEPRVREADRLYCEHYICSGAQILEGPRELPIDRVPIFKMRGWEIDIGEYRRRFGLVRFLKDPVRLRNYLRSAIAEKLMLVAKAPWIASSAAIEGREGEWEQAHTARNVLIYNAEAGAAPTRPEPMQIEAGLLQLAEISSQDVRDISNIHEASLGAVSNEVSGKAIVARQRVGELGSAHYQTNANAAIKECGRVINQLIPVVYDTARVVKVRGPGETEAKPLVINSPNNPEAVDVTLGKYSISVTTGPSYETRRLESQEAMLAMVNSMPETMAVAADLIVKNMDWPGADEIVRRLRAGMPPGIVGEADMSDEQKAQLEAQAQAAEEAAEIEKMARLAEIEYRKAQAQEALARAQQALAQARSAEADSEVKPLKALADVEKMDAEKEIADKKIAVDTLKTIGALRNDRAKRDKPAR